MILGLYSNMKIQVVSDIHLEHRNTLPDIFTKNDYPKTDYLFLCGDIGVPVKNPELWKTFIDTMSKKFKRVIYVCGNHEFYGSNIHETTLFIRNYFDLYDNIVLLEPGKVIQIEDFLIIGATLWSEIDLSTGLLLSDIRNIYNKDNEKLKMNDINKLHQEHKEWLETMLNMCNEQHIKSIVVTHYVPSFNLIHEKYLGLDHKKYIKGYASHCDDLVSKSNLWLFGHSHKYIKKIIGNCLCYANPYGYINEHDTNYKDEILDI